MNLLRINDKIYNIIYEIQNKKLKDKLNHKFKKEYSDYKLIIKNETPIDNKVFLLCREVIDADFDLFINEEIPNGQKLIDEVS